MTDIIVVIDCRGVHGGLYETLASIGAAKTIILGGPAMACRSRVVDPQNLAASIPADGSWLCPLAPGDRLAPGALGIYAATAEATAARLIYSDDDLLTDGGERFDPHFKPQWNAGLFEHHDFITGASIIFASPDILSGLPDSDWERELVATVLAAGEEPVHVPRVLHHRLKRPGPVVPRRGASGLPKSRSLVSVIVPTRNQAQLLGVCLAGLRCVKHHAIETIVIDNGSDEPATRTLLAKVEQEGGTVLRMPGAFNFSALNNTAVRHATGRFLCFLNNDVEMIDDDWLGFLVRQAARPEIGATGAQLLYPDHTIQHAGVFTGIGGGAGHAHRYLREDEAGYFQRARLPQHVSAVTAACLVVARDKFVAVGGFDETDFAVAFNDVDLCLKLNARGWQSFYEPRARLIHHESKSRGKDSAPNNRARFAGELAALKRKWHTDAGPDPFHHPQLSRFSEQFVLAV